jgi:acyl-CoA reductase-like NAD-dependent aldehyde dehydrogenase
MRPMFVNGKPTPGRASGAIEVRDPATEELIESVPRGTAADVEDAVAAARAAFPAWRACVANERAAASASLGCDLVPGQASAPPRDAPW